MADVLMERDHLQGRGTTPRWGQPALAEWTFGRPLLAVIKLPALPAGAGRRRAHPQGIRPRTGHPGRPHRRPDLLHGNPPGSRTRALLRRTGRRRTAPPQLAEGPTIGISAVGPVTVASTGRCGVRTIALDSVTVEALKRHRAHKDEDREERGTAWGETGRSSPERGDFQQGVRAGHC